MVSPVAAHQVSGQQHDLVFRQRSARVEVQPIGVPIGGPYQDGSGDQAVRVDGVHAPVQAPEERGIDLDLAAAVVGAPAFRVPGRRKPMGSHELDHGEPLGGAIGQVLVPVLRAGLQGAVPRRVAQPEQRRAVGVFEVASRLRHADGAVAVEGVLQPGGGAFKLTGEPVHRRALPAVRAVGPATGQVRREAHHPAGISIPEGLRGAPLSRRVHEIDFHPDVQRRGLTGSRRSEARLEPSPLWNRRHGLFAPASRKRQSVRRREQICGQAQSVRMLEPDRVGESSLEHRNHRAPHKTHRQQARSLPGEAAHVADRDRVQGREEDRDKEPDGGNRHRGRVSLRQHGHREAGDGRPQVNQQVGGRADPPLYPGGCQAPQGEQREVNREQALGLARGQPHDFRVLQEVAIEPEQPGLHSQDQEDGHKPEDHARPPPDAARPGDARSLGGGIQCPRHVRIRHQRRDNRDRRQHPAQDRENPLDVRQLRFHRDRRGRDDER